MDRHHLIGRYNLFCKIYSTCYACRLFSGDTVLGPRWPRLGDGFVKSGRGKKKRRGNTMEHFTRWVFIVCSVKCFTCLTFLSCRLPNGPFYCSGSNIVLVGFFFLIFFFCTPCNIHKSPPYVLLKNILSFRPSNCRIKMSTPLWCPTLLLLLFRFLRNIKGCALELLIFFFFLVFKYKQNCVEVPENWSRFYFVEFMRTPPLIFEFWAFDLRSITEARELRFFF